LGVAVTIAQSCEMQPKKGTLVGEILMRIADKWTLLVIDALDGKRELRFSRLQQRVGGISQKMLKKTLRQLERDDLVTRRVHATVPPRVDYKLTPLGEKLGVSVCGVWLWVEAHMNEMQRARRKYDRACQLESSKIAFSRANKLRHPPVPASSLP
jgi:DNA-binding HxlR family transcriptional regulator